jgi:hypothetical protein
MRHKTVNPLSKCLRRVAIAAAGLLLAVMASTVHASAFKETVLVPPAALPELARQTGDAIFLYETVNGRTLLYIEQSQGTQLAIFDVTDPAHIQGNGSVRLESPGTYDFVSNPEHQSERIRFRDGHGEATLDLYDDRHPKLKAAEAIDGQVPRTGASADGFAPSTQGTGGPVSLGYQVVVAANSQDPMRILGVKQVRAELTRVNTGTTFLLADDGLYVIRRPAVEYIHQVMMISPN